MNKDKFNELKELLNNYNIDIHIPALFLEDLYNFTIKSKHYIIDRFLNHDCKYALLYPDFIDNENNFNDNLEIILKDIEKYLPKKILNKKYYDIFYHYKEETFEEDLLNGDESMILLYYSLFESSLIIDIGNKKYYYILIEKDINEYYLIKISPYFYESAFELELEYEKPILIEDYNDNFRISLYKSLVKLNPYLEEINNFKEKYNKIYE